LENITDMLICYHAKTKYGNPICTHLFGDENRSTEYYKWFTGTGLGAEYLCKSCTAAREEGQNILTHYICKECYENYIDDNSDLIGLRGAPEVYIRDESTLHNLVETVLPDMLGTVISIAPFNDISPEYLLLNDQGKIFKYSAHTNLCVEIAIVESAEDDHEQWGEKKLTTSLYVSPNNDYFAILNDYGEKGWIIDLNSGKTILELNGGDYYNNTVPFSFAFVEIDDRTIAVHRSSWNRLDLVCPSSGKSLSVRGPTSYEHGEERPKHYLDYFHGALYVSPDGTQIIDDGWVWHPIGIPRVWRLDNWTKLNIWESEDGPSVQNICYRHYYWDHGITWIDNSLIAIEGIGEDDELMVAGARIFDISQRHENDTRFEKGDIFQFAGPTGKYFSDGVSLFSSDKNGFCRWNIKTGYRTAFISHFNPTHYHKRAREFVQVCDGKLIRWKNDDVSL